MKGERISDLLAEQINGEWGEEGNNIAILRTTNFTNHGYLDFSDVVRRNVSKEKILKKKLKVGDTIIEKSVGSPTQPVGRVVYFDVPDREYLCNNFTSILRPSNEVDSKYFFWILFANHVFNRTLKYQNKTTGIINLKLERYLEETQIPFPSLPIQKKIAAILDKADSLRRKDKQLLEHYNQLAQSIFYEMFGDPVKNEMRWITQSIAEANQKIQIGPFGSLLHESDYISKGIPLINPKHIIDGNIVPDPNQTVSKIKYNSLLNYAFKKGDVVMGRRGEMGRCAIVTDNEDGWLCGTGSLYIRPSTRINSTFLYYVMSSHSMKCKLEHESLGATLPNLNATIVSNLLIPVPSIELQKKFELAILRIRNGRSLAEQSSLQNEILFQSLVQKAFKGELVKES